jgi:peptide-methionine (S)-S-oxide reductase
MKATFGAGCFWQVQAEFDKLPIKTMVGYMGGKTKNPSYEEVCQGNTGHVEVCQMNYSPPVTYQQLLDIFWKIHNPTQGERQGTDIGDQYRSVIFYYTLEQKESAEKSKLKEQKRYKDPITTNIEPAQEFYPAEEYHQKYVEKNE